MTYMEIGNMNAEVVADLWFSYQIRRGIERIEFDHRQMISAILSSGAADERQLEEMMDNLHDTMIDAKIRLLTGVTEEDSGVSEDGYLTHEWWDKEG